MSHERFQDLKESYALGALSAEERREVEEYLAENPAEQTEIEELASVASLLALAPEEQEPPERLRKSLLRQVRSETDSAPAGNASRTSDGWMSRLFGPRAAAAGVAVIALAALLIWNVALQTEVGDLQAEVSELRDFQMTTYELQGSAEASGVQGQVVNLDDEQAMLVASDLPPLPEGQTYEMWTIDEGGPEPCGLLTAGEGPSIEAIDQSLRGADTFAITVEPEGGSPQPTSDPIVTADLQSRA